MTIQLSNVSKTYGSEPLFTGVDLQIGAQSRIGLIGRNGCGKSTLIKLIMKQEEPSIGTITHSPGLQVNYLSQEPRITPHYTLAEEMRSVFAELDTLEDEEKKILSDLENTSKEAKQMALTERLYTVQQAINQMDPESIDGRISRILKGLGFTLADHGRKTAEFSGGWQMRINLAKVLLEGSDILLLDEPTNHLDLETCEWMENFLQTYPGGIVVVSHDRRFLDQVTTEIAEFELGKMTLWPGNYSAFLAQKEAVEANQLAAHQRQSKDLAKQTEFVERFKASASRGTQAKSREKQLSKVERIEAPKHDNRRMTISFPVPEPSGKEVLTINGLSKSFGDKHLFKNIDTDIERKQRIFLLGENGTGKTTLLRLIQQIEKPDTGNVKQGYQVKTGYFSQNQLETLDPKLTVLDTIMKADHKLTNTEVRNLLGRVMFSGDQVYKKVDVLSGGEKSKLALAKLILTGPNFLLLDEPTNHMDIPAKEAIIDVLKDYEGTILCISHDRHFIQSLATDIWELYNQSIINYTGDYDYYLLKRDEYHAKSDKNKPTKEDVTDDSPSDNQAAFEKRKELKRDLKRTEKAVVAIEKEIKTQQKELNNPKLSNDYVELDRIAKDIETKQTELDKLNEQWIKFSEALEVMG